MTSQRHRASGEAAASHGNKEHMGSGSGHPRRWKHRKQPEMAADGVGGESLP